MLGERIPLRRVKTVRNTVSGKNTLNNCLKEHAYRLSQISFRDSNLTTLSLRNIMDVSILGGWCSTAPTVGSSLALGLIWRCQEGCWGWGSCRRQRHWKRGTPPRGEGTLILKCWSLWLGPAITRWHVNIHFCVKDVSLVWGWLFLLN